MAGEGRAERGAVNSRSPRGARKRARRVCFAPRAAARAGLTEGAERSLEFARKRMSKELISQRLRRRTLCRYSELHSDIWDFEERVRRVRQGTTAEFRDHLKRRIVFSINCANDDSAVLRVIGLAADALAKANPRLVISYPSASPLGMDSAGSTRPRAASSLRNTEPSPSSIFKSCAAAEKRPHRECRITGDNLALGDPHGDFMIDAPPPRSRQTASARWISTRWSCSGKLMPSQSANR